MGKDAPVIFIHYGPSRYLRWTLRAARRSNPGKKIYFLGDSSNKQFVPHGIEFVPFESLGIGAKLRDLRGVFQPLEGSRHIFSKHGGTKKWLSFVFERWFLIEQFIADRGISRFWTFDSDTMIAADLLSRESGLADFEATQQCRGCCLNGLVNSAAVVGGFTSHAIDLFANEAFLAEQKARLRVQDGLAFNEMDVWQNFRDAAGIKASWLGDPSRDEVFDDALAMVHGFEEAARKVAGKVRAKKVLLDSRGGAFAVAADKARHVRLVTLNLSWMPDYIFKRVLPYCRPCGLAPFEPQRCRELNLAEPFSFVLQRAAAQWRNSPARAPKPVTPA